MPCTPGDLANVISCQLKHIPAIHMHEEVCDWIALPRNRMETCHYSDPPSEIVVGLLAMAIVDLRKVDTSGPALNARSLGLLIKAAVAPLPNVNTIPDWQATNWVTNLLTSATPSPAVKPV